MNWVQFQDPLCYLCLHGAVVSSLYLMREVVGSRLTFYKKIVNEFSESHLGKTPLLLTKCLCTVKFRKVQRLLKWKTVTNNKLCIISKCSEGSRTSVKRSFLIAIKFRPCRRSELSYLATITNYYRRHGFEFDCNQEAPLVRGAKPLIDFN